MADSKNNQTPGSDQNKGSGSDTVSAAKISAGTSVGTVAQSPPMPEAGGGPSHPGQSATLASHTSHPLGGAGSTGKEHHASSPGQGGQSTGREQTQGPSQGQSPGMTDTMRQTAEQVRDRAGQAYDQASEWMSDTYESASSQFRGGRAAERLGNARRGVQEYVAQNPVMVGIVGLAAGLLLGALLPRTRREDETFGRLADEVREQGLRYAHEMTQRGREMVDESFSGEDPRFSKHESEFGTGTGPGANRH
jgi:ElaB/YqjD/DUF883 family membrane-anchored ribosome-binding protein